MAERDFLDEMIAKRTKRNPQFPKLLAVGRERRERLRARAERREKHDRA